MSEQVEKKKFSFKALLAPKNLAVIAVILLVLAVLILGFASLVSLIQTRYGLESAIRSLTSGFLGSMYWLLPGLLLPACLFLVDDNTNKIKYAKILFIVGAAFVGIQLLSACVMAIYALVQGEYGSIVMMANAVSGSDLLSSLVYLFKNLFSGARFIIVLRNMTVNLCNMVASLLFVLANAVCAFGFIKLSSSK